MARSMFAEAYRDALQDLTGPDMAKIKLLRDLAKENKNEAANVVQVLSRHAQTCKEAMRLPAIYLMDCMLKTVDAPYPDLLAGVLPQVFSFVWDRAGADLRNKLARTAGTWKDFLPGSALTVITQKMQPVLQQQSLLQQQPVAAPVRAVLAAPQPVHVVMQPPAALQQPIVAYSASGQPLVVASLPAAGWPQAAAAYGNMLLPTVATTAPAVALPQAAPDMSALLNRLQQQVAAQQQLQQQQQQQQPSQQQAQPAQTSGGGSAKDNTQALVDALASASDQTRAKFLDLQFVRNRRLQAATHLVRPWFVKVEQWLVGTRAVEQEAGGFFEDEQESQGAGKGQEPMMVEEDPSQPSCAISGETFERTYDPDTDKWYYEDAVVLTGEQAAAYGVMEGSIIKASCLAGGLPPATAAAIKQGPLVASTVASRPRGGAAALGSRGGASSAAPASGGGGGGGGGGAVDGTGSVHARVQPQPGPQQQQQQEQQAEAQNTQHQQVPAALPHKRNLEEQEGAGASPGRLTGDAAPASLPSAMDADTVAPAVLGAAPEVKRARLEGVAS